MFILSILKLLLISISNLGFFFVEIDKSFKSRNVRRFCWRIEIRRLSGGEFGREIDRRQGGIGSVKIDTDCEIVEELSIISSLIGDGWRKLKNKMI